MIPFLVSETLEVVRTANTKALKAKDFPLDLDNNTKYVVDIAAGESAEDEAKERLKKAPFIWLLDKFI